MERCESRHRCCETLHQIPVTARCDSSSREQDPSPIFAAYMRIWLDADATPRDVKDIVFRAADRLAIETVVVANQRVPIPPGHPTVSAVRVEGGPDVADRYIATNAQAGDL